MKMRKLLAVVLAVTLAISAMAISVFADEYKVDMYNYTSTASTSASTTTFTIEIPVSYLYGYLTAGNYLELTLPTNLTADASTTDSGYYVYYNTTTKAIVLDSSDSTPDGCAPVGGDTAQTVADLYASTFDGTNYYYPTYNIGVSYSLTVNGVTVNLLGTGAYDPDNAESWTKLGTETYAYATYTQKVNIGTYALHAYSGTQQTSGSWSVVASYAMIPNAGYLATDTITINATVDWSAAGKDVTADTWEVFADWWLSTSANNYSHTVCVEVYENVNGTAVGSPVYGYQLSSPTKEPNAGTTTYTADNVIIVANVNTDTGVATGDTLYWNHTLENRMYMLNAANTEGATAKLVVKLADSIYGYAVYTLSASAEAIDSSLSTTWSNSGWYATEGLTSSEDIAKALGLYNATADTYVLACDSSNAVDTLEFDVDTSLLYNSVYGVYNGTMAITQAITLSTGDNSILSSKYYTNSSSGVYSLEATEVYLLITMPGDEDVVETEQPVEVGDTTTEEDGEDVDDVDVGDDASEPAETNPTTGIVLALVPMAVAAAAAVASKRR